jgi:4'-phosphopantetheinyl transferase
LDVAADALPDQDIHVWRACLDQPPAQVARLEGLLDCDELRRLHGFRFAEDRARFAVAHGLVRLILASYTGVEPGRLRFHLGPHGKPHLSLRLPAVPPQFNASHSGDLLLIAVSGGRPVGIDIERIRSDLDWRPLAERICTPRERAWLYRLPAAERVNAFFRCWVRKEAYVKLRGDGLLFPVNQLEVAGDVDPLGSSLPHPAITDRAGTWWLRDLDGGSGHVAALASTAGSFE